MPETGMCWVMSVPATHTHTHTHKYMDMEWLICTSMASISFNQLEKGEQNNSAAHSPPLSLTYTHAQRRDTCARVHLKIVRMGSKKKRRYKDTFFYLKS